MTLDDMKALKNNLERNIETLIEEFQNSTGVEVRDIFLENQCSMLGKAFADKRVIVQVEV